MKKRIIFIVTVSLFVLGALVLAKYNYRSLKTDSGFDSSYDSGSDFGGSDYGGSDYGGSDYGGSWGSSRSRSYGGSTGDPAASLISALLSLLFFGFIMLIAWSKSEKKSYYLPKDDTVMLAEYNLNKAIVCDKVFEIIKQIQLSIFENKFADIKPLVSNKLFDKLNSQKEDSQAEYKIKDIERRDAFIFSTAYDEEALAIGVELKVHITGDKKEDKSHEEIDDVYKYSLRVLYDVDKFTIDRMDLMSKVKASEDIDFEVIPTTDVNKQLEKYGVDKNQIIDQAYKIYEDVQIAWMNDTLDDVKNVISNELYNQYDNQLQTLRVKNEQNVMSDIKFIDGYILSLKNTKDALYIKIIMGVTCKDYIIKKDSGKVLRGSSNLVRSYRYQLTYRLPNVKVDKCPECGAPIEDSGDKVKCQYCGSDIVRFSDNLVLTDKKIVSQ